MLTRAHLVLLICRVAFGGVSTDDFALSLFLESGTTKVTVTAAWDTTNWDARDNVQGWSFGVCHDSAKASIGECLGQLNPVCGTCPAVTCPPDLQSPQGQEPGYHSLHVYPNGITQEVLLDFMQTWWLRENDTPFDMLTVEYTLADPGSHECLELAFCDTLGVPPLHTEIVVAGRSFPPVERTGTVLPENCGTGCPELTLKLGAPQPQNVAVLVPVLLDTDSDHDVGGFQFGLALDDAGARINDLLQGQALAAIGGADFFGVNLVDDGATLGCAVDLEPDGDTFRTLPACTRDQEIALAVVGCGVAPFSTTPVTASLSGEMGDPSVAIVVDVDGTSLNPLIGDPVSFEIMCDQPYADFVRGDVNQDGVKNVSDGVAIAKAVFAQGSKFPLITRCMDSADADDDEEVDMADAIYLLEFLFLEGPAIPVPAETCGQDPSGTVLTCEEYTCP